MKRESLYVVLAVIWALTATIYATVMAATNFTVKTPFVADLFAGPSDLKIEEISFNFNAYTNRYDNVTLTIKNYDDSAPHSGTVYVTLYDSTNTEIASGSVGTGTISPGVRLGNIVVRLTWTTGYSASDFDHGRIVLTQTS